MDIVGNIRRKINRGALEYTQQTADHTVLHQISVEDLREALRNPEMLPLAAPLVFF